MHRPCTLRLCRNAAKRRNSDGMALYSARQWQVAVASRCSLWLNVLRVVAKRLGGHLDGHSPYERSNLAGRRRGQSSTRLL